MNDDKKINISDKVIKQIKDDDVKMRSKWIFVAEKLGMESGVLLSILIGIIMLSFVLYVVEKNGAFEFTEFGFGGWLVVFDNIPYDLVIIAIVFFIIANYIIRQFDFSYRKHFYLISCGVIFFIMIAGLGLMWSGVSHSMFDKISGAKILSKVYENKITNVPSGEKAVVGKVVKISPNSLLLQTPQGKIIEVKFTQKIEHPMDLKYGQGQMVKIFGSKNGEVFRAQIIRVVKPGQSKYFREMPPPPPATNAN